MALPIQPTPILKGKAAEKFEKKIQHDLQVPVCLKATPKIENARKIVKQHAIKAQK